MTSPWHVTRFDLWMNPVFEHLINPEVWDAFLERRAAALRALQAA